MNRAVVLGASMGGLLAARVLADFYDTVTIIERDVLPEGAAHRRGVPQGRHVHALLGRGLQILGEFFPGFRDELLAAGTPVLDYSDLSKVYFSAGGHVLVRAGRFTDTAPLFFPSRPLVESIVRQRIRAIENVTLLDGYDVVDLTSSPAGDRVTGVRIRSHDDDSDQVLTADLVVDATGRGSRTPAFLESLGYPRPSEDHLDVGVSYSSQLLRIPPGMLDEVAVLVGPVPGRPTGMALFAYENDTWIFTVLGMVGHEAPDAPAEMRAFVDGLAPAHVLDAIGAATPLSDVCRARFPQSRWRRYDKLRSFPAGLLVLGDAVCSFNPVAGQGMTVAALQAKSLRCSLRRGGDDLPQRYFRAAAKPVKVAWKFAVNVDLNLPEVSGPRPLSTRLTNRYVDWAQTAAESDVVVAEQLMNVIGFLAPAARLLRPKIVSRILTTNLVPLRRIQQFTGMRAATVGLAEAGEHPGQLGHPVVVAHPPDPAGTVSSAAVHHQMHVGVRRDLR
jgi:2-polyprenyl-6-methoxyphenol hydroxylase-like FAD-dependent oxidoreductase